MTDSSSEVAAEGKTAKRRAVVLLDTENLFHPFVERSPRNIDSAFTAATYQPAAPESTAADRAEQALNDLVQWIDGMVIRYKSLSFGKVFDHGVRAVASGLERHGIVHGNVPQGKNAADFRLVGAMNHEMQFAGNNTFIIGSGDNYILKASQLACVGVAEAAKENPKRERPQFFVVLPSRNPNQLDKFKSGGPFGRLTVTTFDAVQKKQTSKRRRQIGRGCATEQGNAQLVSLPADLDEFLQCAKVTELVPFPTPSPDAAWSERASQRIVDLVNLTPESAYRVVAAFERRLTAECDGGEQTGDDSKVFDPESWDARARKLLLMEVISRTLKLDNATATLSVLQEIVLGEYSELREVWALAYYPWLPKHPSAA
jgi:hypothetical protein